MIGSLQQGYEDHPEADLIYNGAGMGALGQGIVLDGLGSGNKPAVETSKDVKLLELEEDDDHDHEEKKDRP